MKVVINRCYGGFAISLEAARYMAERGHAQAKAEVAEWEKENGYIQYFLNHRKWPKEMKESIAPLLEIDAKYYGKRQFHGYGYVNADGFHNGYRRDDPLLVEAVQILGDKASGEHSALKVVEVPDGVEWEIDDYDGMEHVAEKHRIWS